MTKRTRRVSDSCQEFHVGDTGVQPANCQVRPQHGLCVCKNTLQTFTTKTRRLGSLLGAPSGFLAKSAHRPPCNAIRSASQGRATSNESCSRMMVTMGHVNVPILHHPSFSCFAATRRRAAACGNMPAIQQLYRLDPFCKTDATVCAMAAAGGHLEMLQWLRAQDPPCAWDEDACKRAAGGGHLDVLQWLRAQDPPCPWSKSACVWAAGSGHLEVLKWLRAQTPSCPWTVWVCAAAIANQHHDVVAWLRAENPTVWKVWMASFDA